MNELVENHDTFDINEFVKLVNAKLTTYGPNVVPIDTNEAKFYHETLGLGVETTVEEHVYFCFTHG